MLIQPPAKLLTSRRFLHDKFNLRRLQYICQVYICSSFHHCENGPTSIPRSLSTTAGAQKIVERGNQFSYDHDSYYRCRTPHNSFSDNGAAKPDTHYPVYCKFIVPGLYTSKYTAITWLHSKTKGYSLPVLCRVDQVRARRAPCFAAARGQNVHETDRPRHVTITIIR